MAVGMIIMAAIYASVNFAQKSSASVGQKVVTQQDVRSVLDFMAMEIRMASYNPTWTSGAVIWSTIPTSTCNAMGNIGPVTANRGIQTLSGIPGANTITVAMDLDGNGVIGCTCGACCGPPNTCTDTTCAGANEYIQYSYNGIDTITRNVDCGISNTSILGGAGSATMVRNAAANTEQSYLLSKKNPRRSTYSTDVLVRNHALSP